MCRLKFCLTGDLDEAVSGPMAACEIIRKAKEKRYNTDKMRDVRVLQRGDGGHVVKDERSLTGLDSELSAGLSFCVLYSLILR